MPIQTVVFDIGNVFVRWAPLEFIKSCFPGEKPDVVWGMMKPVWLDLNYGTVTLQAAVDRFGKETPYAPTGFKLFCDQIMGQVTLFNDTIALQKRLKDADVPLYCISDNIREVIAYYDRTYDFMQRFKGRVISADIGRLKPDPVMYQTLLDTYRLDPERCVFFDDVEANVQGAQKAGMAAFVFTDARTCEKDLKAIGLQF